MSKYLAIIPLALALVLPAAAADKKKDKEQGITREQADQIIDELRQIRELLEKQQAPAEPGGAIRMNLEDGPWMGNKAAPVTIVEFTDYQCSYCRQFHVATFPELKKKYIDTGKVRFASRDMPLDFHSNASHAAEAARCAGDQGQFWQMRDRLISNASRLSPADVDGYAQGLKLDMLQFRNCLDTKRYGATVRKDVSTAESFGVNGTPSFLIGKSTRDGVSGALMMGALPFDAFETKLRDLLQ